MWFGADPSVSSILEPKQYPRNPSLGLAFCPTSKGAPGADVCQVLCKAESGRAGTHGPDLKVQREVSGEPAAGAAAGVVSL